VIRAVFTVEERMGKRLQCGSKGRGKAGVDSTKFVDGVEVSQKTEENVGRFQIDPLIQIYYHLTAADVISCIDDGIPVGKAEALPARS
jgi:hypothetical protein